MIRDDIIKELQYIPESKLIELYDLIHYFRLGLDRESVAQENEWAIDKVMCLETLQKINQGDLASFSEIADVEAHVAALKNEIN